MQDSEIAKRLLSSLTAIRKEMAMLMSTYTGKVSLRCMSLNDQCDLLEDILGVPRTYPRATWQDR